jgi:hypothetical protein
MVQHCTRIIYIIKGKAIYLFLILKEIKSKIIWTMVLSMTDEKIRQIW